MTGLTGMGVPVGLPVRIHAPGILSGQDRWRLRLARGRSLIRPSSLRGKQLQR